MILDIGCGYPYLQTLLHHSYGNKIIGIDISDIHYSIKKTLKTNGAKLSTFRKLVSTIFKILENKIHIKTLDSVISFPIMKKNIDVRIINAHKMLFMMKHLI